MISNVVNDILLTFRQSVGYCLIVAILALFVFLYAKEKGMKEICLNWLNAFKQNKDFRWLFVFVFYVCCIMFVTLFCRYRWTDSFQNVLGVWGLYDANGHSQQNFFIIFFFLFLLAYCYPNALKSK